MAVLQGLCGVKEMLPAQHILSLAWFIDANLHLHIIYIFNLYWDLLRYRFCVVTPTNIHNLLYRSSHYRGSKIH